MATPAPDYVAETLRQAHAVADQQAENAARHLTRTRAELAHAETAHTAALARRDALAHELRLRAAAQAPAAWPRELHPQDVGPKTGA